MVNLDTRTQAVAVEWPAIPDVLVLPPAQTVPADRHPVKVYLSRLDANSVRTMHTALNTAAMRLTGGRLMTEHLPWASLVLQQHFFR